jgi:hypothetical protein
VARVPAAGVVEGEGEEGGRRGHSSVSPEHRSRGGGASARPYRARGGGRWAARQQSVMVAGVRRPSC